MNTVAVLLAQEAGGTASLVSSFVPMILIFGVFYFLVIRPQVKRQNEHKELLQKLKQGDEVVTQNGLFGKILEINERVVTLDIGDSGQKVRVRILRDQIIGHQKEFLKQNPT